MPALDSCHPQIVRALEKTGWVVLPKPFTLPSPINNLFVDIQARRPTQNGGSEIIVVEVKCFADDSFDMHELYVAIGQYLVYRDLLQQMTVPRSLYLAIPTKAYYGIFRPLAAVIMIRNQMQLIVINLDTEEVVEWVES